MMLRRIRHQNVEGSMRTVLQLARGTIHSLDAAIARNVDVYQRLQATEQTLTGKLADNQPRYEQWRLEKTRLAEECAKLNPSLEQALAEEGLAAEAELWPPY